MNKRITAAIAGLLLLAGCSSTPAWMRLVSQPPTVVTRDEVLAHWSKMPLARAAAPQDVDREADRLCARIRQDSSAASIISNAEQLDRANGGGDKFREYLRLMVAYKCPENVKYFG